ncbi:MAG: DUF2953 domain-containing protein, partial [Sarcina sp.]
KLRTKFENNEFEVYLYRFKVFPKKKKMVFVENSNDNPTKKTNTPKKKKKKNPLKNLSIQPINLMNDLVKNKFKPTLFLSINSTYSLTDAAITAELFGLINIFLYFLVDLLNLFIDLKPNFEIIPSFENKNKFDGNIVCIIKISLAQIIVILILVIKNLIYKGEKNNGKQTSN